MSISTLFLLSFVPMLFEARLSRRHDQALRAMGAREPAGDVYAVMQIAYPACFLAMLAEGWARGLDSGTLAVVGLALFAAAKGLKYWAIATLGWRWTFRVLVPPGSSRIVAGPYRFLRHPNYLAVLGELAGMALMTRALFAGSVSLLVFGSLLLARIRVEERALRM